MKAVLTHVVETAASGTVRSIGDLDGRDVQSGNGDGANEFLSASFSDKEDLSYSLPPRSTC